MKVFQFIIKVCINIFIGSLCLYLIYLSVISLKNEPNYLKAFLDCIRLYIGLLGFCFYQKIFFLIPIHKKNKTA
jgi:hypothetical protein